MRNKWIDPDEFFIGYLPNAPARTSALLKNVLLGTGAVIAGVCLLLLTNQKEFSDTDFEYGKFTTVEGVIYSEPIPHIRVIANEKATNSMLLLVGYGKFGAQETIAHFNLKVGELSGKRIKIEGQLIHGKGKALLQISKDRLPKVISTQAEISHSQITSATEFSVTGEIVDPKCYFGVMKPGEGKPHRSCAIRCISGGIPPVFHQEGSTDYYLLLDENLQPINELILDIVGDRVTLSGKTMRLENWDILAIDTRLLKEQALFLKLKRNLLAMESGMTICGMK
jgi:hypothetical protein